MARSRLLWGTVLAALIAAVGTVVAASISKQDPPPPPASTLTPYCRVLSYEQGSPGWLKVEFKNVKSMSWKFVAAAGANAADSIWVQRGKTLAVDGDTSLEGYGFKGRVAVLYARDPSAETFMREAQSSASSGSHTSQAQFEAAGVRELCDYVVE